MPAASRNRLATIRRSVGAGPQASTKRRQTFEERSTPVCERPKKRLHWRPYEDCSRLTACHPGSRSGSTDGHGRGHQWTQSANQRSEEHTSELQSPDHPVCRLLLLKKKTHHRLTSKHASDARGTL